MTTTFENARSGDEVWSPTFGWGVISSISTKDTHPICVEFKCGNFLTFTIEGKYFNDTPQILFWDEIKFEIPVQPPRMKLIHGVEVPDISFTPREGDMYYYPSIETADFFKKTIFGSYALEKRLSENNLCYPFTVEGKQAAILHAKVMLGIKE